ncbi:MAG: sulfatase, partial [Candidatus Sumerlaeota bacterium]
MHRIPYNENAESRPNILFLFSDQHSARCLSCAGHSDVQTPHLDRLAAEGVRFTNAYVQNTICTPSRMSYLSSTYCSTHGYYGLYGHEPDAPLLSMFEFFLGHGYRTGALGKLHTPRYWIEHHCQYVYDEFIQHPSYLEALDLHQQNDNRGYHENAKKGGKSNLPFEHSCESVLVKHFRRFLHEQIEPADQVPDYGYDIPWMAWVSFARPHQPYTPSEPFASMYDPEKIELPPVSETESPALRAQRQKRNVGSPEGESELRHFVASYLGVISQTDAGIGLILDELENSGHLDNTIIVYAADHGDHGGEHGLFEKKAGISARSITRTPLIVRYPKRVVSGAVREQVVEAVDVFPTLCELAGLQIPKALQGRSMVPLLGDHPEAIRRDALTENRLRKAIATGQYRFVANLEGESDELYDTLNDPFELKNLIDDPDCAEVSRDLQRRLLRRLAEASRPVTAFRGGWLGHRYDENNRL